MGFFRVSVEFDCFDSDFVTSVGCSASCARRGRARFCGRVLWATGVRNACT